MNLTFGSFEFDTANGVYTKRWREMHGAERTLTILKSVGTRGVKVLNSVFEGKTLELTGEIIASDNEDLISLVRNFVRELSKNAQPLIYENDEGSFVYDDVYVTNTGDMVTIREYDEQRWAEFRVVFLCPKGFARSTTQVTQTSDTITELPYTDSIMINGDTNPEPVIEIQLPDVSTLDSLYFVNNTTNTQISIEGVTLVDGDLLKIDILNKRVQLNNEDISFDGVFPDFIPGLNEYQLSGAGGDNQVINQNQYNAEETVYGSKKIGWKFTAPASVSLSQLALLIKRVESLEFLAYDTFDDNSENTDLWTYAGTHAEEFGKMRVGKRSGSGSSGSASSAGKHVNRPYGFEWQQEWNAGGDSGPDVYARVGHNTGWVEARSQHAPGTTQFNADGDLAGLGGFSVSGTTCSVRVVQDGSVVRLYVNDVLRASVTATLDATANFEAVSEGGTGTNFFIEISYLNVLELANSNGDLTVRVETDTAGAPSGSIITNGSITVPAADIGTAFAEIIKAFATNPAITDTTVYHIVISQAAGDVNNYYVLKKQNTDVFASANLETYDGAAWTQVTGEDLYAKLWSTMPTDFEIVLLIKYFASYFNIV